MDVVDAIHPNPVRDIRKPFLMVCQDVFSITAGLLLVASTWDWLIMATKLNVIMAEDVLINWVTGLETFRKTLTLGEVSISQRYYG